MRAREVVKEIERRGGRLVSQRGSHAKFRVTVTNEDGTTTTWQTIVAMHTGDVPLGTLKKIEADMAQVFGEGWLTK